MKIWLNGLLMEESAARISPFDHGLLVGDGAFESLITYDGRMFAMARHAKRLAHSCAILGIPCPAESLLREACEMVISANGLTKSRLRITVTSGVGPLGSDKGGQSPTLIVAGGEVPRRGPMAPVVITAFTRNETAATVGVKSTSYAENVIALAAAKSQGASEAIFPNTRGELCEGTGSNVFLVSDGKLCTSSLASGCLSGVTRSVVVDLCLGLGIPLDQSPLPCNRLGDADEAFLTSTFREVQPISSVDGRQLPNAPGPVTERIRQAFNEYVHTHPDPDATSYEL